MSALIIWFDFYLQIVRSFHLASNFQRLNLSISVLVRENNSNLARYLSHDHFRFKDEELALTRLAFQSASAAFEFLLDHR